jgi:anion-transporting  ArsA/GET3 family ATPase
MDSVPAPLDKRLLFVTGKGGVGKSTVAIALGLASARRGARTIVAELSGRDDVTRAFGQTPSDFDEIELADGLFAISIDPQHAMEEYLRRRTGALGELLAHSRMFQAFTFATPGMRELLSLGKAWELAQHQRRTRDADRYDLVIVDAPATGHGVGLLRTPSSFAEIARVGPIASQGRAIHATIVDPSLTGVIAVALPEEMPVTETLALQESLDAELGLPLDRVIVNACLPERIGPRQAATVERALARTADPLARAALAAARSEHLRASHQREQIDRLAEGSELEPLELPFVFAPELDRAALEGLADVLEAKL